MDILDYWFTIRIDDTSDPAMVQSLPVGTGPLRSPSGSKRNLRGWQRTASISIPSSHTSMRSCFAGSTSGGNPRSEFAVRGNLRHSAYRASEVGPLSEDDNYSVHIIEAAGSIFNIIVNVNKAPFDPVEVRQALSYSLNREAWPKRLLRRVSSTPITLLHHLPASLAYRKTWLQPTHSTSTWRRRCWRNRSERAGDDDQCHAGLAADGALSDLAG